jgi:hypothetical protein
MAAQARLAQSITLMPTDTGALPFQLAQVLNFKS